MMTIAPTTLIEKKYNLTKQCGQEKDYFLNELFRKHQIRLVEFYKVIYNEEFSICCIVKA